MGGVVLYQQKSNGEIKHLDFILMDLFSIETAFFLSCYIRHGFEKIPVYYLELSLILALFDICVVYFFESYKNILRRGFLVELKAAFHHVFLVAGWVVVYLFVLKISEKYSRQVILTTFGISLILVYVNRIILKLFLYRKFKNIRYMRSIMVVTTASQAERVLTILTPPIIRDYKITELAIIDQDLIGKKIRGVEVTADQKTLIKRACSNIIDEVFIDIPEAAAHEAEIAKQFLGMGITVHINMDDYYAALPNRVVENINGLNVLTSSNHITSSRQRLIKRAMDITGAIVGLCITGIVGLFVAPAIYIRSPGPILFSQTRIGKNGRKFKIYKFRSMYLDAEKRKKELMEQNKMSGLMFKMDDDPRIIKGIGNFIRKTSIDELPQFFNVLMGDMSLVGTRPPTEDEYEKYELHHKKRLSIKPGITGMWQVSGRSDITNFEDIVQLDNNYIENGSLSMDIKILVKTVKIVLFGKGAV